jgi:hypothetical protein
MPIDKAQIMTYRRQRVELPEFGADAYLYLRELTAAERRQVYERTEVLPGNQVRFPAHLLIAMCATDDPGPGRGEPAFSLAEVDALPGHLEPALRRMANVVLVVSGLLDDERAVADDAQLDAAKKNS